METNYKTLQIQIPNGYEIDESKSTFENIVFKKKDSKPRSWREYCHSQIKNEAFGYFICESSAISGVNWELCGYGDKDTWRNMLPSKEYAEAFLALMQLISLRKAWVGDWEPDWNAKYVKWVITQYKYEFLVREDCTNSCPLSFPTKKMADDFLECFRDLLEQAKILL